MLLTRLRIALPLMAAATLPSSAAADGVPGPCDPKGNCHLSRWVPSGVGTGDQAGHSVALHGDRAAVSGHGGNAVYIYERTGATWSHVDTLFDPLGSNNHFGYAMDMSEDFLAIGAPFDSTVGPTAGAVHLYQRIGGDWIYDETLFDATPTDSGYFGYAVGVDGPWLGVGAPNDSTNGRAHAYLRTVFQWELVAELDDHAGGLYGESIAVQEYEGELAMHLLIGDPANGAEGNSAGAVVHARVSPGGYQVSDILAPAGLTNFDGFGGAVAYDEGILVVGAKGDDTLGPNTGAAYVFEVEQDVFFPQITLENKVLPCDPVDNGTFGGAVAVEGAKVAVGAANTETAMQPGGRVYVFVPNLFTGAWQVADVMVPGDGTMDDFFGWDVEIDATTLLVGARGVDEAGALGGAAYLVSTMSDIDGGQCPCDSLGSQANYGTGKAGFAGVPEISGGDFVPGESTTLKVANCLVGVAPIMMWGTIPAEIPLDEGTLLIGNPRLINMPVVGVLGQVGMGINVPDDPILCGLDVYFQALFLDPGASGQFHTAQTDGLRVTVGY